MYHACRKASKSRNCQSGATFSWLLAACAACYEALKLSKISEWKQLGSAYK